MIFLIALVYQTLEAIWLLRITNKMEENILRELVKSKKILKKKFDSVKRGEAETFNKLEYTLKPLTEPLKKLVKLSGGNSSNPIVFSDKKVNKFENNSKIKRNVESISSSTPKKKEYVDYSQKTSENEEDSTLNTSFYSQTEDWNLNLTDLFEDKELDTIFGPYKDQNGDWKFGNSDIKLNEHKITIGNKSWALTPGLYSLLFHKKPEQYDPYELNIYKGILLDTNAHRRNYDPNNQLKGNRGFKYKEIISKLFPSTYVGSGLMKVNLNKPNYIYWDNPNEIVDRLKLLIASQQAGNNNLSNEIVSIIEELKEAKIIE